MYSLTEETGTLARLYSILSARNVLPDPAWVLRTEADQEANLEEFEAVGRRRLAVVEIEDFYARLIGQGEFDGVSFS